MKKLLLALALVLGTVAPMTAMAASKTPAAKATKHYSYCTDPSQAAYRAVYEYPTGTYWVGQITAYPAYYKAHNAQYLAEYGC